MRYEDRVTIATPEGVDVELTLAGIGSRFIGALIDTAIKIATFLGFNLFFLAGGSLIDAGGSGSGGVTLGVAVLSVVWFLIIFGYDVMFETLGNGRTPGKMAAGLRVVRIGGRPVGFMASAIRNILRLVDFLPSFYVVGMVSVAATRLNQRLGDLAAGTVVVRERQSPATTPPAVPISMPVIATSHLDAWDVSAVTATELATIRRFLDRRHQLTPPARRHLGEELARKVRPKVAGAPDMAAEAFLEYVAAAKARRA